MILAARYVVPADGPVIDNGAVAVREGLIAGVGPASQVDRLTGEAKIDYGDAVICPGFINAHTHLELSSFAGKMSPSGDLIDWLFRVTTAGAALTQESVQEAVRGGLARSLAAGVTTIGDTSKFVAWTREVLAAWPVRGVSFGEVASIGKRRHLLAERLEAAASLEYQSDRLRTGISPHAPYSVEPEAMRACADRARALEAPLSIHLAESAEEEAFTRARSGRFVDLLRALEVWDEKIPSSGCGPVELAAQTGLLGRRTVIAHGNYVSDDDIRLIADSGASVAYCPRTHEAFGHPAHRFGDMAAAGVNVCIGTDSLASSPSLSILDELRFLRRAYQDLRPEQLIKLGTLAGAQALGFADIAGTLTVGKAADLAVVPLDPPGPDVAWDRILESQSPPIAVYVAGVQV